MKPYGERIPRVHWRENHGCPCCDSYKVIRKDDRKPSKVRERQQGKAVVAWEMRDLQETEVEDALWAWWMTGVA